MARQTRLDSHGEPIVEAIDLDDISQGSDPSTAGGFLAEEVPLFLTGPAEEVEPPAFGRGSDGSVIAARILKTGIFAVLAVAIVLAIFPLQNPLALFANAKASLIGGSAGQAGADPSTPAVRSSAGVQSSPTREEIAAALRAAQQSQPEIRQRAAAAPPARHLDADELAALLKRARGLIAIGDIASARLLLERAADAQEASAALLLAQTYDPAVLGTPDARSITPDSAAARGWYQKAAQLGSLDARQRLAQMRN
jgi:hypothetical protein